MGIFSDRKDWKQSEREWTNQSLGKKIKRTLSSPKEDTPVKGNFMKVQPGVSSAGNWEEANKVNKSSSSGSKDRGGLSKSEYKKTYGKSYDDGGSKDRLKSQEKAAKKARDRRKKSYNKLYDQLRSDLVAQKGDVEGQRGRAISGLESGYENAMTRAQQGKEDTSRFYKEKGEEMTESFDDQKKERARIFQARNITNSSYYIDAVTEADTEFNKLLSGMNKDQARTVVEQDTQIKELGEKKMKNRAEIETAFSQAMRQIQTDLTKTDFERSNAMENLGNEYNQKMGQIAEQMMVIEQQQQEFRNRVSDYSVGKGYQSEQYGIDLSNENLKMKSPDANMALLEALSKTKGTDSYVNPDEYMRLRSSQGGSPGTFNARYGGMVNPTDYQRTGLKGADGNIMDELLRGGV